MAEEPSQQAQEAQEGIRQKVVEAPDLPLVYTNSARVSSSFFDFRIIFSESRQTGPSEVTTTAHVAVIMSPEHAKALADALNTTIEQYEAQFGKLRPLPTPPSATP
jgi:Protein of unknown function (DUF3467)